MSAADNVSRAQSALSIVNELIEIEAADQTDDAAEGSAGDTDDAQDVETLRAAASSLVDYISATTQEVGTPDDLEEVAEEQTFDQAIRAAAGYY